MPNVTWFVTLLNALNIFKALFDYLGLTEDIKKAVEHEVDQEVQQLPHPILHDFERLLCMAQEMYQTVDAMLLQYLSLDFDTTSKQEGRLILLKLEEGQLLSQIYRVRPSARKITALYYTHIRPWLSAHLAEQERDMGALVTLFSEEDQNMIYQLEQIATLLADAARETLDLVDHDQLEEANLKIKTYRKEWLPLRRVVNETIGKLLEFEQILLLHGGAPHTTAPS